MMHRMTSKKLPNQMATLDERRKERQKERFNLKCLLFVVIDLDRLDHLLDHGLDGRGGEGLFFLAPVPSGGSAGRHHARAAPQPRAGHGHHLGQEQPQQLQQTHRQQQQLRGQGRVSFLLARKARRSSPVPNVQGISGNEAVNDN